MNRLLVAAMTLVCAGAAAPNFAQTVDKAAAEAACGPLEREAIAGRARMADVVACAFREAARQLNAQMPLRVDDITTVESVAANGPEFLYNVRVQVNAGDITAEQRSALAASTRNNACAAGDMRQTIANGGSYRYRWIDRSGRPLHETLIAAC